MTEHQAIDQAYAKTVEGLYRVLLDAYVVAANPDDLSAALDRFKSGVTVARVARSVALSILSL